MTHSDNHSSPLGMHPCGDLSFHTGNKTSNRTKVGKTLTSGHIRVISTVFSLCEVHVQANHSCLVQTLVWLMNAPVQNRIVPGEKKSWILLMLSGFFYQINYEKHIENIHHIYLYLNQESIQVLFSTDASRHNQVSCFLPNISDE